MTSTFNFLESFGLIVMKIRSVKISVYIFDWFICLILILSRSVGWRHVCALEASAIMNPSSNADDEITRIAFDVLFSLRILCAIAYWYVRQIVLIATNYCVFVTGNMSALSKLIQW
jgi:hypothetical protein